jgi:hypothetical protein
MTLPLRDTNYARELATARLLSGPGGTSYAAIERILVKQTEQIEVRFSLWEASRMMPGPWICPRTSCFPFSGLLVRPGSSPKHSQGLRGLAAEVPGQSSATDPADLSEMARLQAHFHSLIRARAGGLIRENPPDLPRLSADVGSEEEPAWYPVEAMHGGFKYWWDRSGKGLAAHGRELV